MVTWAADLDWVDRANGLWTALLLAVLSLAARVSFEPATCWLPPQFTASHAVFAQRTAGVQTSYLLNDLEKEIPISRENYLTPSYHLYVPLILFFQAVGFFVPFLLWRVLRPRLALDLTSSSASLTTALATGTSGSNAMVRQTASLLLESVSGSRTLLTAGYLGVKCLSLVNVLAQFIALSVLFRERLGFSTGSTPELPYFPVEIIHDFSIRQLQTVQKFTVQCSLLINDTYIRMFVFLWYWVLLLALITLLNTVASVFALLLPPFRDGAVVTFVRAGDFQAARPGEQGTQGAAAAAGGKPSSAQVKQWIPGALGSDGVLLLSLLSCSAGPHLAARLAQEMWFLTHPGSVGATAPPPAYPPHGPYPSSEGPHHAGHLYPSMPQASAPGPKGYAQPSPAQGTGSKGKGEEGHDLEMKPLI